MSTGKWKSTITIWSNFDPSKVELSNLAREAEDGTAICTDYDIAFIGNPTADPQFEGAASFFNEIEGD